MPIIEKMIRENQFSRTIRSAYSIQYSYGVIPIERRNHFRSALREESALEFGLIPIAPRRANCYITLPLGIASIGNELVNHSNEY